MKSAVLQVTYRSSKGAISARVAEISLLRSDNGRKGHQAPWFRSSRLNPEDAHGLRDQLSKMEHTRIREKDEGEIDVIVGDVTYELIHDPPSGDWLVFCGDDRMVQDDWMLTRDDAIQYALYLGGTVVDPKYDRAPDRTSA